MQICQDQLFSLPNKGPQHLQIDECQNSQKVVRCSSVGILYVILWTPTLNEVPNLVPLSPDVIIGEMGTGNI